jgi:hypothetical protein
MLSGEEREANTARRACSQSQQGGPEIPGLEPEVGVGAYPRAVPCVHVSVGGASVPASRPLGSRLCWWGERTREPSLGSRLCWWGERTREPSPGFTPLLVGRAYPRAVPWVHASVGGASVPASRPLRSRLCWWGSVPASRPWRPAPVGRAQSSSMSRPWLRSPAPERGGYGHQSRLDRDASPYLRAQRRLVSSLAPPTESGRQSRLDRDASPYLRAQRRLVSSLAPPTEAREARVAPMNLAGSWAESLPIAGVKLNATSHLK